MNSNKIFEHLDAHATLTLRQAAFQNAYNVIVSAQGEGCPCSSASCAQYLLKDKAQALELEVAEVEEEIIQMIKSLEAKVAILEAEIQNSCKPRPIWSGWSL